MAAICGHELRRGGGHKLGGLYYILRLMSDYKVQVDETTELLYGLMTDRKIKVAKAIIKQIVKDSENLTTLDPNQVKE